MGSSSKKNRRKIRFYTTVDEVSNALGVTIALLLFYAAPLFSLLVVFLISNSPFSPVLLVYVLWMYWDRDTPHRDGRRLEWVCSLWIYQRLAKYFPQTVVKTSELSTDQNYLLCLFPHGIIVSPLFAQFIASPSAFSRLFPGIKTTMHVLNVNFLLPFMREYSLFSGLHAVSREALLHQLNKPPSGQAAVLVPGGSAEVMVCRPGSYRLILKSRKGFIKLAIVSGASLVPIYSFGETDLYEHQQFPKTTKIYRIQQYIRKKTGVAPVLINGGGLFQDRFGILPRPRPVVSVVGEPINVTKNPDPSDCEVNALHAKFTDHLVRLFEKHKYDYLENPDNVHLSIEE